MKDYIDYSEPLLNVKAMIRTLDAMLLEGNIEESIEYMPEIITELRLMQNVLVIQAGK